MLVKRHDTRNDRKPDRAWRTPKPGRYGVIVLELILFFPILLILLAAVTEFGIIFTVTRHVASSSRMGAKFASENRAILATLNVPVGLSPGPLREQIDRHLASAGINTGACQVILQHNVPPATSPQFDPTVAGCDCAGPTANAPSTDYVRVTVCVPLAGNVPDLLATFGFSIAGHKVEHTTTYPLK